MNPMGALNRRKVLCVGGSLNQTSILHKVARCLPEMECSFSPFFAEGFYSILYRGGFLEHTIMGGAHRRATIKYIQDQNLPMDEGGRQGNYDLVLTCTDLIIQPRLRKSRIVLIQEGIVENEGLGYWLVRNLRLPRVIANTAATGLSDAYEYFCVASSGYRSLFVRKGVKPRKIIVTGIPIFDQAAAYTNNQFPHHGYVLVATSSIRETFGYEDRMAFLYKAKAIAGNQQVIIKLHPNEDHGRAEREIRQVFPASLIFRNGNLHEMIANCDILIAQNTSAIFTAAALGKKVIAAIPEKTIRQLLPLQNGGSSAVRIAEVCRKLLNTPPARVRQPAKTPGRSLFPDILEGF
jgi:hypothetical protein